MLLGWPICRTETARIAETLRHTAQAHQGERPRSRRAFFRPGSALGHASLSGRWSTVSAPKGSCGEIPSCLEPPKGYSYLPFSPTEKRSSSRQESSFRSTLMGDCSNRGAEDVGEFHQRPFPTTIPNRLANRPL